MIKVIIGWLLFLIALFLMFILTIINFFVVRDSGYFRSTALSLDRFGNVEFRSLFNKILIKENGYQFGNPLQTISCVLGYNELNKTYTKLGLFIIKFLNFIDKNHCIKAITNNENLQQ